MFCARLAAARTRRGTRFALREMLSYNDLVTERRFIGVLLAAGKSSRMGRTKQLMAWTRTDAEAQDSSLTGEAIAQPSPLPSPQGRGGQRTVVEASFDTIAPHCAAMIVVVGHDAPLVIDALHPRTFEIVISDPFAEMLHSVQLGLIEAQRIGEGRGVLLHLADVPGVSKPLVNDLIRAADAHGGKAVMPEFVGHGGHPVIIPAKLIHSIVTWKGAGGLREFWRQRAVDVMRVPVEEAGVVRDLDEPGDYEKSGGESAPSG